MKNLAKKKKVILSVVLLTLIIILLGIYLFINKKDNKNVLDNVVVSTITLDINPSIKIELNKNNQVINIISLNDDAKDILITNYKGKEIKEIINNITDKLIDKGYAKEELVILLGVSGSVESEEIKEMLANKLTEKEISYDIIIPEITDSAIKLAKEYNITESKASYIEETINKYSELKIEDIKNMSIKDISDKVKELESSKEEEKKEENTISNNTVAINNNSGGGSGSLSKCDYITVALTNEEAGKKAAGFKGATVGTDSYCDILPPESVIVLAPDGTCAYKVSFKYRTERCTYYIGVETGNIIGSPSCNPETVSEGEAQCIIMKNEGITARENLHISAPTDNGSEYIYNFEDVYGAPDEEGQRYIYEYRVSKYTGQITKKEKIDILH